MYTSRISDLLTTQSLSSNISSTKAEYLKQIQIISSGYKYLNRSDDPTATSQAQNVNNQITTNSTWSDNVSTLKSWESTTDSTLQSILDELDRLEELTTESQSGTQSSTDSESIATEVNSILETLVQYANTSQDGVNIFAGTSSYSGEACTTTTNTDGNISSVSFLGVNSTVKSDYDQTQLSSSVSASSDMSYGTLFSNLFVYDYTSTDSSTGTTTTTSCNLFQELINFRDYLNGDYTGTESVTDMIGKIEAGVTNASNEEVGCAARENHLTSLASNLSNVNDALETRASDLEDMDEAEAITDLYNVQTALTAALQMTSKLNDLSLVNYI